MLASKYDELDARIPMISDYQRLGRYTFTLKELLESEGATLMTLNWNMITVTPLHFVQSLSGMGFIFEDDRIGHLKG